jgi:1,3-beta-glucanosyltransferase GAS1
MLLSSFLSLASSFLLASASLPAIVRDGTYLFDSSSGDRFYVKGVAYASNYGSSQTPVAGGSISAVDPLANSAGCSRDIPYFQQLGINLIRVYQVNSSLDHSECMSALSSAGIYVLLDLATPADNGAISTTDPEWNVALMTNFIETIEAFGNYDNIFGFNIGNEVVS